MKEISYDGQSFQKEESAWLRNHRRAAPPLPATPTLRGWSGESTPTAEDAARALDPEREEDHHFGFIIFVLTLVLAFGIGVGAYVLIGVEKGPPPIAEKPAVPEVVAHDTQHTDILLDDSPYTQVLVDIALAFEKTSLTPGGVHRVSFVMNDAGEKVRPATVRELLHAIRAERPPETLLHSLENTMTYEIHSGTALTGKLTLTSRSRPHTLGALYDWEGALVKTFIPLLHPLQSTGYMQDLKERKFRDERIGTIDARVLLDIMEKVVLIYGFTDQKTLIIAGSKDAFLSNITGTEK